ncbi:uncharacterized protein EI90DRAFT_3014814 [Cantharellus anzutake]|uniref:uncharacterized protein n=1 Tax=Cantharellus anzutake TaxID=1750568 RepID=UPI001904E5FC|nr:uncharacterized protein EI90DRAFT_3014814 [Cantharellus anzutake]KAF8335007.1 hypothetical protein EI90DRAFT_3014814 [Cantharellus anzutake]
MIIRVGFGAQPQGSPQEWGLGQGPDGPPQEHGFKGWPLGGVWGAAPGSPQEWGLGQRPNSSPQEQGFKGLAPLHMGNNNNKDDVAWGRAPMGSGATPQGVQGAALMPSTGARDRRTHGKPHGKRLKTEGDTSGGPSQCELCAWEMVSTASYRLFNDMDQ